MVFQKGILQCYKWGPETEDARMPIAKQLDYSLLRWSFQPFLVQMNCRASLVRIL